MRRRALIIELQGISRRETVLYPAKLISCWGYISQRLSSLNCKVYPDEGLSYIQTRSWKPHWW